jgi:hypothetical protein
MRVPPLFYRFSAWALLLPVLYVLLPGCANMSMGGPPGGLKDSLPPKLIKANPPAATVRIQPSLITLEFDEYVQFDDLQTELVVNPPMEKQPDIEARLRTVRIRLRDSLQSNTTYSFFFGNALKDVNEGNVLKGFNYVFSTGPYIDSLMLAGTITDAETGMPDSTLLIMLYSSEADSAVAKQKPRFITRPNGKGEFRFTYLPYDQYYLFALKDEGLRRYISPTTPFAYYDQAVRPSADGGSFELRSFVAEKEVPKPSAANSGIAATTNRRAADKPVMAISASANANQTQDLLSPLQLSFSRKVARLDSTLLFLADTNHQRLQPPVQYQLDSTGTQLSLSYNWRPDEAYRLHLGKGFATDSMGTANRADTIEFKAKAESEYGLVRLQLSGLDTAAHPLLQWVENNAIVRTTPVGNGRIEIPLFKPGQYTVRILYDRNQNGRWDTGDYWRRRQPELVIGLDQKFTIKANWENEFELSF